MSGSNTDGGRDCASMTRTVDCSILRSKWWGRDDYWRYRPERGVDVDCILSLGVGVLFTFAFVPTVVEATGSPFSSDNGGSMDLSNATSATLFPFPFISLLCDVEFAAFGIAINTATLNPNALDKSNSFSKPFPVVIIRGAPEFVGRLSVCDR